MYKLSRGSEVKNIMEELIHLHSLSFGNYPGVLPTSKEFLEWYIERPGLGLENTLLFLDGDKVISSLFLTLSHIYLEGELTPVGIIDIVFTHPAYRRKGLTLGKRDHRSLFLPLHAKHGCLEPSARSKSASSADNLEPVARPFSTTLTNQIL